MWKIPVVKINDLDSLEEIFINFERLATLPKGENVIALNDYTPAEKVFIMFGSEADGLSNDLKSFANKNITIEMASNIESLNLSVSVAVVMYKLRI